MNIELQAFADDRTAGRHERNPTVTEPDIRVTVRRRYVAANSASALDYD